MYAPKTAKRLRFKGAGKKVHEKELDIEVMNWILFCRAKFWRVTEKKLKEKALEIARSKGDL